MSIFGTLDCVSKCEVLPSSQSFRKQVSFGLIYDFMLNGNIYFYAKIECF